MRWPPQLALAAAVVTAATAAGSALHQHVRERAERIEPALYEWRGRFERDARRIEAARLAAEQRLRGVARDLSFAQARIVRLDALAGRLMERVELDGGEFDFGAEPGLGGPEEAVVDAHASFDLAFAADALSLQVEDRWRQLRILEDLLKWRELNAAVQPDGRPVAAAYISSGFGARIDPFTGRKATHKGIDFAGRPGTEIVAVAAGIVTWSGTRAGYGRMVEIDHGNGQSTRYAHNSVNLVEVGEVVTRGQPIAKLGSTGRASGPNLHFEVLLDGQAVNPGPYIE